MKVKDSHYQIIMIKFTVIKGTIKIYPVYSILIKYLILF